MLENFIEHLNQREKEAFFLIKNALVLEDGRQNPVMRVALRALKDFATPFKITSNNAEMVFWKYHLLTDEEFDKKVQKIINPHSAPREEPALKKPAEREEAIPEKIIEQEIQEEPEKLPEFQISKPKKKSQVSEFAEKIKDYLAAKDIEVLLSILEKKKEFMAKIRADTLFGKQEYYLIAKDKKKITETDITLALQKAQAEKMPALIICPGEIDKKAHPHLKEWKNMIKFERVKL